MEQAIVLPGTGDEAMEVRWTVDLAPAGRTAQWARGNPALLEQEVAEMGTYFPRWVLSASDGTALTRCARCADLLVFREGKLRCLRCGRAGPGKHLAWTGHLPVPVAGLPRALERIHAHPHPGYPLVRLGATLLWLVPLLACYPADWPRTPPVVRYDAEIFRILGIPAPGASHHIVSGSTMCLYGWDQWRAVTMRVVLQQRVVNHVASLLKIGEGQAPVAAFAGKQHLYNDRDDWR
jgi:hypothetical protein